MTPQEASEELKEEFEIFKNGIDPKHWENPNEELRKIIEANTMAIEVLGQQLCEDAISRQAVRDVIFAECSGTKLDIDFAKVLLLQRAIKALPPVTPQYTDAEIQKAYELGKAEQPKTGHWIGKDASSANFYGKCSCCGQEIQIDAWYTQNMKYCPNCGAKMESEVQNEDSD